MKIAIVKLSALGDIVHAMIVLQVIKIAFPASEIDWIVEEVFAPVLEHNPQIDTILPVNLKALKKDKKKLFSEIKKLKCYGQNNYDVVLDMQGLIKSAFVSKLVGHTIGFDKHSIREKWAALLYDQAFFVPYEQNVIERNIELVKKACAIKMEKNFLYEKESFLYYDEADKEKTASFLDSKKPSIVHILGSSWESKVYPKEKFVEVVDALEGNHLLVWGNESEEASACYVAAHTNAVVLPKMNLNELKALISQADLVIGGDSGPTHFAWAMNRPSITLFGPTPSERNTVVTPINRVLDCEKTINPLKLDKEDFCIQTLQSHKIVSVAKELLV